MSFFRRIFGGVQPSFLVRSYLIGLIFFVVAISMPLGAEPKNSAHIVLIMYAALSTVLFPFAKLSWDELRDLVFGNNVIFMNAVSLLMLKWTVNILLWASAIFIAPVGILYLWFRTRQPKN